MHKFIFKFKDIDKKLMEELHESLLLYYGFLSKSNIISKENYRSFREEILELKQELIDKMNKYNSIRHDESISENEKEKIREELFEGDHEWMFL